MDPGSRNCFAARCLSLLGAHEDYGWIQAPCLCTAAYLVLYHVVVRRGCCSMDQGTGNCFSVCCFSLLGAHDNYRLMLAPCLGTAACFLLHQAVVPSGQPQALVTQVFQQVCSPP